MKKVIIIGAGIAGLTAASYALQSGFDVTVYESHKIPGGASTSWRRKGYLFEGGMHWLTGSSRKAPLYKLWCEVGALNDSIPIYNRDPFSTFEYRGQTVCLYRDIDKLYQHLLATAPEDKKEIRTLYKDIRRFSRMSMPLTDIKGVKVKHKASMPFTSVLAMLPAIPRLGFYGKQTAKEYSERFQSPILRMLLQNITGPDYSAVALVFTMAILTSGDGGYPEGGSLAMASRIAKKAEALGGKFNYGTPVSQVVVQNGAAKGVMINGQFVPADAVIVTQDALAAVDSLFDPPIQEEWADKMRKNTIPVLDTFISVGVEADLSDLPENLSFVLEEPLICGGISNSLLGINNYSAYPGYAPKGCTALTCILDGDNYDYWKSCKENGIYEAEKQKLAEDFIRILAQKFPQTEGKIAVWDVATPLTYERYLGSYKGSWMTLTGKGASYQGYPITPEHIKNVYFAGQRISPPGGLPPAAETGRKAVQYLCRDMGTVFQGAQ